MKKASLTFLSCCLSCFLWQITVHAQTEKGINFIDQALDSGLTIAKQQNKLAFVDCYTSWCSPCKWMSDNIFTMDTVADFYNQHFIDVKMDMEKDKGPAYTKKYNVRVFPTYLFLDGEGNLVHKSTSRMEAAAFLDEGNRALSTDRSSSILQKKFDQGDRSTATLLNYAEVLEKLDRKKSDSIKQLLAGQVSDADLKTALGWAVIRQLADNPSSRFYMFLQQNKSFYEQQYGRKAVDSVIGRCMVSGLYRLSNNKNKKAEFFNMLAQLRALPEKKYQVEAAKVELSYYLDNNDVQSFIDKSNQYTTGLLQGDDAALSFMARRANYTENKALMEQAYVLAERAVKINPEEYANQGTLAEICYATGRKAEAVKAAKKAYSLSLKDSSKIQKIAQELVNKTMDMP